MSNNFRHQTFVLVSENLLGKVPVVEVDFSSHEQKNYITTSIDGICVEFEFQTELELLRWTETDVIDSETEVCQWLWLRNLQYNKIRKRAQRRGKSRWRNNSRRNARGSSFSRHSCEQQSTPNLFHCWSIYQKPSTLHFRGTVCAQVFHFQQLQGSDLSI